MLSKAGTKRRLSRNCAAAIVVMVGMILAGCTGKGGGTLAPKTPPGFNGRAHIAFNLRCEYSKLHVSLDYNETGTYPVLGVPFQVHGEADAVSTNVISERLVLAIRRIRFDCPTKSYLGGFTELTPARSRTTSPGTARESALPFETLDLGLSGTITGCRFTIEVRDTGEKGAFKWRLLLAHPLRRPKYNCAPAHI